MPWRKARRRVLFDQVLDRNQPLSAPPAPDTPKRDLNHGGRKVFRPLSLPRFMSLVVLAAGLSPIRIKQTYREEHMSTSNLDAASIEANARLREQVAALSERLREILAAPSDPLALAKARYVLAKVDQLIESARSKSERVRAL